MSKLGLIISMPLLAAMALYGQEGAESKPYPAAHNTPSSRQSAADFSQSSVQGCLVGSTAGGNYVLTNENTDEIYVLHGSDALLKQHVGHEVVLTGTATPIRPSNKKGTLGYVSPESPTTRGTSSQGAKALKFQVTFVQPIANACAQQTQSQRDAIAASQAALGSLQGEQSAAQPQAGYGAGLQTPSSPQQSAANAESYPQDRNLQTGTELPGASQHISAPEEERKREAEEAAKHYEAQPTLVGCLTSGSGPSGHEFYVTEQRSGTRYRLNGVREQLKDHVNHLVELVGKPGKNEGMSKAVAANNQPVVEVDGVQDLAPTCGASH